MANTGVSWCTATQLYPMLHYGGQSLLYGRKSTGRCFRECFWRLLSFCCGHAQTLVALLIATAIVLAFDDWPGDIFNRYFTLECKATIKTGLIDHTCRGIWLLRFTVFGLIVTILKYADELKSRHRSFSNKLSSVDVFMLMDCVHSLDVNKSISRIESTPTMKESSVTVAETRIRKLLLLLSGDVESNPGPWGHLSIQDLKIVIREVWDICSDWFNIGLELDLDVARLEAIESECRDVRSCMMECIKLWLRRPHPPPTWSELVKALRSPTLNLHFLAQRIESEYMDKSTAGLKVVISEYHLGLIADLISEWEGRLADELNLNTLDVANIKTKYPTNLWLQTREALRIWKQRIGSKATYSRLIHIFESAGYRRYAEEIRRIAQDSNSEADDFSSSGEVEDPFSMNMKDKTLTGMPPSFNLDYFEEEMLHDWSEDQKKEREIILSNRVKLTQYIHDVTVLFPSMRQDGIFTKEDCFLVNSEITGTMKVDKFIDILLTKGPKAIGHFHSALEFEYPALFEVLSRMFVKAGVTLPPERQIRDEDDIELSNDQILASALEQGYVLLNISKVVTSGAAGSGKTCTRHVLLGEKPPPRRISTALFHVSRVFRDISRELVATDKVARWFPVSGPHLNEMIAKAIKKGVSHEAIQHGDTIIANESRASDTSVASGSEIETDMNDPRKEPTAEYSTEQLTSSGYDTITTRQDILQLMEEHTGSDELMRLHWIYFIDCGGQPQFHDLLPAFVKNKSVILLVIKLSEQLEEYPTIQYYSAGGTAYKEYVSRANNIQILQHYCRTLVSNNKDCYVLVVGTHRDIPCNEESVEEKDKIIAHLLEPSLGNHLVRQYAQDRKILYPLNAQNPSQEDFGMAALIRKEITKQNCTQQFKVPIAWFLLEQDIQQKGKANGVISLRECLQLAYQLKMNQQALQAALEYFDKLSILLYFPLALPDIVFTDSQVIIDKVTEIVSHSYYLRSLEEENSERQQWSDFLNFGVVSREMLLKHFPTHYVPKLFTVDELLELFQHLLIVAQLNCNEFVMPAVLPEITTGDLKNLEPSFGSLTPALIYFPDGCAPGGAFCCLSVHLISECGWRIADVFYRNYLKFKVGNITVTLIDSFHYYKVYIQDPNVSSPFSACKWVIASISTGLGKAYVALNYDKINHSIGILCPCKKEEHVATLDKQLLHWTCTKNSNVKGKMSAEFAPWHHLHNQVELPTETRRKWKKGHRKDIDQGSYLKTIGLLFTLSVLFISVYAAKYRLYPSGWSLSHPTASEGLHGHNLVPPTTHEFHLPGMQLIGFETFTLQHSTEPQTIAWSRFGFKLHIPPDAISGHSLNIGVGVSLSGNFKFPSNTTLVSAVYYINASSKLLRPVTVEMEHCLLLRNDDDVHAVSFYVAEIHPGLPHYTFQPLRGGIFSSTNSWGSIQVSSFSLFSISWIIDLFTDRTTPNITYSAQIYHRKASGIMFNVRLVVTRHLSPCKEAARIRYCEKPWSQKDDFQFYFFDDSEQRVLSLEINDTGFDSNGWWIKPSSPPPEIRQENIDGSGASGTSYDPAHCALSIRWTDKTAAPQSLYTDIRMKGISTRSFEITLDLDSEAAGNNLVSSGGTPTEKSSPLPEFSIMNDRPTMPQLEMLERKDGGESVRIIDTIGAQYQELGTYLLNDKYGQKLNKIKDAHKDAKVVCHEIFREWLAGKGKEMLTWKTLVYALGEHSQLKSLADDIVSALQTYAEPH